MAISPAFSASAYSASNGPIISNWTESAQPNDTIGMQGFGFGPDPEVWFARVSGDERAPAPTARLKVLTGSDIFVAARIPASIAPGLYAVWVRNAGRQTGPVWINRARQTGYEFPEVPPGGRFRIFGRNLALPSAQSHIAFFDPRNRNSLAATVSGGDQYVLSVTAPSSLVPGVTYEISVSNGYGGKWGMAMASMPMRARRPGPDHWNLKVPWAADFDYSENTFNVKTDPRLALHAAGNGTIDDRPAIQASIDRASATGGGVVYLPPGIYPLKFTSGQGLLLRSRVVLQGAGKDRTILFYGYGPSPPGACALAWPPATFASGVEGLTFRNTNASGHWLCNIRNLGAASELFVHNIRADLNTEGGVIFWKQVTRVLLADSDFLLGPVAFSPYWIEGVSWFVVRNSTFRYLRKRMAVISSEHGLIEANHSTRNGTMRLFRPGDSGGLDVDFVKDLAILGNTFDTIGNVTSLNDGETINSQGCNPPHLDLGSVTDASATVLRDKAKHWTSLAGYVVAIVTGPGAGQWRRIVRNTPTDLAVDRPWQLIPPTGSRYVITQWSAEDLIVKDNLLRGNPKGIWIYCGGADIAIVNNKLLDSSGIWLRADQRTNLNRYNLIIGAVVADNTIISQKGKTPSFVAADLAQVNADRLYGTGVFNLDVRRNNVRGSPSEPHDGALANGMWSSVRVQHQGAAEPTSDTSVPGIVGPIFENNSVSGCTNCYNLTTGDFGGVVIDRSGAGQRIRDQVGKAAAQGSVKLFLGR